MRAIIVATNSTKELMSFANKDITAMLPVANKPFIQHIVEFLAEKGFDQMDFLISPSSTEIALFLGDGARWGSKFTFHLTSNPRLAYQSLKKIELNNPDETILLASTEMLPEIKLDNPTPSLMYCYNFAKEKEWTGWGWVLAKDLIELSSPVNATYLFYNLAKKIELVENFFSLKSLNDYLQSNFALLSSNVNNLALYAKEYKPGIWVGRNSWIHPNTKMQAPIFIGEDCYVDKNVSLGPNVIIGNKSVLANNNTLVNSIVLPENYVGEGLQLENTIVNKEFFVDAISGIVVKAENKFSLTDLSNFYQTPSKSFFLSLTAILVGALALPLSLFFMFTKTILKG
jgi:NDP-sugar pyrophosphorylase family protein